MRKPNLKRDFNNEDGSYDYEGYEETMGDYEDAERDRELEEQYIQQEEDVGDQIHEQNRDEKDENESI